MKFSNFQSLRFGMQQSLFYPPIYAVLIRKRNGEIITTEVPKEIAESIFTRPEPYIERRASGNL